MSGLDEKVRTDFDALDGALAAHGYDSVEALLHRHPGVSYITLGEQIGVLPVALIAAHLTRAYRAGASTFREAARDSLARHLNQSLPHGWNGSEARFDNIVPFSSWATSVETAAGAGARDRDAVFEALERHARPGWRPSGADDPVLVAAFNEAWS